MSNGQILILDTDLVRAEILGLQFRRLGFTSTPVAPYRVSEAAASGKFELVVVDASVPVDLIASLRDHEHLHSTPVMLVASEETNLEAILPYVNDCLKRPLDPALLRLRCTALVARTEHDDTLRVERDLQIARDIQRGFLPQELPQLAGWEIAAKFEPAYEVAGDFYDVFYMSNKARVGFIVADVCDKGIGAALFMGLSRSLLRAFAQQNYTVNWANVLGGEGGSSRRTAHMGVGVTSLKNAVTLANDYIAHNHSESNMFATLFFGVLDPEMGTVHYVNAGHNPPLVVSAAGEIKARLGRTGSPLGIFPDMEFGIEQTQLEPGDLLLAFTDGVTEAKSATDEQFTEERLEALVAADTSSATGLIEAIQHDIRQHVGSAAQSDDITMLAIRRISP